jgi:hypothetical protein
VLEPNVPPGPVGSAQRRDATPHVAGDTGAPVAVRQPFAP